jgi:uncharacterized delta-60 repeat protein
MLHALAITRALRASLVLALSFVSAAVANAQDGANDPTFNTLDDGAFGQGAGGGYTSEAGVLATARQPDGRLWVTGSFRQFHGRPFPGVTRLNPDGSVDTTFTPGLGVVLPGGNQAGLANAIVLQPDGKAILGGFFDGYDGAPRANIARALPTGAIDLSFVPPQLNGGVIALALQPNGKVLIGGNFTTVGGVPRPRIARLNADGSLDMSFEPGRGAAGTSTPVVLALELQPDGRVLVGGSFLRLDGAPNAYIGRLNQDGSVDTSFATGLGLSATVRAMALQPNGAVLVAGEFQSANGVVANRVARLAANGAVDSSFNAGAGPDTMVLTLKLQPDGRVLLGGTFSSYNGTPRTRIARILSSGSLDTSFDPGSGVDGDPLSFQVEPTGHIVVAGAFLRCNEVGRRGIARLAPSGAHDENFSPRRGADLAIYAMERQPNGKLLIIGEFESYNDRKCNRIARLNADGSFDASYTPGPGPNNQVRRLLMQPDGRAVLAGSFTQFDGAVRNRIARVTESGALDPTFDPGLGPNGFVHDIALQSDGKVVLSGFFNGYDGVIARRVARALPNGQRDASFDVGDGANGAVYRVVFQSDGKLLVGGEFTTFDGAPREKIARLNQDGSLDTSFDPGLGPNGDVYNIVAEQSGTILISGAFTRVGNRPRTGVARLNSNGLLDLTSFASPSLNGGLGGILPQLDGTLLAYGSFTAHGSNSRRGLARLFPNGALDLSFNPGLGASAYIASAVREPGGDLVIAGDFTQYDGVVRHHVARVKLAWIDWANYCTSAVSSQGCAPSISASGAASVSATSGFTLDVQNVDAAKQGLVYYALGGRTSTPLGAGNTSFFCVKAPVQRMNVQNSGGAAGTCNGSFQQDWLAYVSGSPTAVGAPFAAGVNVQAQAWYRDPPAPKSVALSNALEFITVP